PYMYFILHQIAHTPLDLWTTILTGCIVFIPGDMIKIILVSLFSKRIIPILEKSHLLRREA
ncbi:MAG TPA: BioY family transporter, partial [Ruminococcaceae bacterium]|nr:BioY family transporter [Oscillospiraceae bacterium]